MSREQLQVRFYLVPFNPEVGQIAYDLINSAGMVEFDLYAAEPTRHGQEAGQCFLIGIDVMPNSFDTAGDYGNPANQSVPVNRSRLKVCASQFEFCSCHKINA